MGKTVLVVDDFPNTRKVVEFSLNKIEDINILSACDGLEALELFNGQKIDLLISDLNMPKMDGLELAQNVKKIESYKFMPILMLTTETKDELKARAKEIGITGWIKKPFKADEFVKVIQRCLK